MTLAEMDSEIRRAWLELEPVALPIARWGDGPDAALERLKEWTRREPPAVAQWLEAFALEQPRPVLTPEEATLVFLRLDSALRAMELIVLWEQVQLGLLPGDPLPEAKLPVPRVHFLAWLLEGVWHHHGFGKIADVLDNLALSQWRLIDNDDKN